MRTMENSTKENTGRDGKSKRFVPLENNPEVMSALVHKLGLSTELSFHDVYSIEDADLLSFVPRPAYALLLVFPISEDYESFREEEDRERPQYSGSGPQEEVMWYKQTIGNACGLIGLLHGVTNGIARDYIGSGTELSKLMNQAEPLNAEERASLLYDSEVLESAHQSAAIEGNSSTPSASDSVDLHFVCFIKSKRNRLWELDGRRKGPIERGVLDLEDDVLSPKALDLGVRKFLKREQAAEGSDLRFSLIVLSPSLG